MFLSEVFSVLDSRSFSTPWFWMILLGLWAMSGRSVLGIPNDVLTDAGRALRDRRDDGRQGDETPQILLLDWLSLHVPRWRIGRIVGAVLTGLIAFVLTTLAILGFRFGLEMAQALTLLAVPFALLLVLRLRLAHQLHWVLQAAELGQPTQDAAAEAMRRINRYRVLHMVVSILAVMVAAMWGSLWMVMHPNGL